MESQELAPLETSNLRVTCTLCRRVKKVGKIWLFCVVVNRTLWPAQRCDGGRPCKRCISRKVHCESPKPTASTLRSIPAAEQSTSKLSLSVESIILSLSNSHDRELLSLSKSVPTTITSIIQNGVLQNSQCYPSSHSPTYRCLCILLEEMCTLKNLKSAIGLSFREWRQTR